MSAINLFVFSNIVPKVSWLSNEEGNFLHIKKPKCPGNKIVYLVVKIELRSLTQVPHVTKKKKKNRSVKKAKKLRNSLDFIEMAISLLLQ